MSNLIRTTIQISELQIGMTVEHNGQLKTVGKENLTQNEHGISFCGDASKKTITRVQFKVPTMFGFRIEG